ncbi:MAG: class I SAM-dependent methyltransferase [Deltaproteobacteria bacterium]|nr:class I SAM-dependent methyltransferase [Deltaproteobacteria bacterium]
MLHKKLDKVSFWDRNVKWYKLWREHNRYHEPIKGFLCNLVWKGESILDIGAGDGILTDFMAKMGFYVTALEPSRRMRESLSENVEGEIDRIQIDPRRFEDLSSYEIGKYDLVIACNSLHLTDQGIKGSLFKIFDSKVKNILLVTENSFPLKSESLLNHSYRLESSYYYICESSFVYHTAKELFQHLRFRREQGESFMQIKKFLKNVSFTDGHYWIRDIARVAIFFFRRVR